MAVSHPETWTISKAVVSGEKGIVATQHYRGAEVGAQVLRDGGNAVDAAVATSLAMGVVEPWMSGLGGGGFMVVGKAGRKTAEVIDFGMISPVRLDPADYPLAHARAGDLFSWPAVVDDRNLLGASAIAVPGQVAGLALALDRHGSHSWQSCLGPAIDLAEQGLTVDWYMALLIGNSAADIARFPGSAEIFLRSGLPPTIEWDGAAPTLDQSALAGTLKRLSAHGPEDFYQGEIARQVVADLDKLGGCFSAQDLSTYRAVRRDALPIAYRNARIHAVPGLSAGPSLARTLAFWRDHALDPRAPGAASYDTYATGLTTAYRERLETMGAGESAAPSCTTHISVVDGDGLAVSLTQTLLSLFGSKLVLPETGMLMNNGIMWFDPRPGHPNSIAPGKRPLSNMCPVLIDDGAITALGASGGRRILPAVSQMISFLVDYRMTLDQAAEQPRLDANGEAVHFDRTLPPAVHEALVKGHDATAVQACVYPAMFACPNMVRRGGDGIGTGAAYPLSPWAAAVAA